MKEIRNRWRPVFELASHSRLVQIQKMKATITDDQILQDISALQARIVELERDFADSLNPVSSRIGKAVIIEDGVISYMVQGVFVPISEIIESLALLNESKLQKKKKRKVEDSDDSKDNSPEDKK